MVARVASTRMAAYASAKAAVLQLTRCMAFEWARFNIRVNCICPGYIDTNMTQSTLNKPRAYEAITHPIPHNRKSGRPDGHCSSSALLSVRLLRYGKWHTPLCGWCSLYLVGTSPRKTQRFGRAGDLAKQAYPIAPSAIGEPA